MGFFNDLVDAITTSIGGSTRPAIECDRAVPQEPDLEYDSNGTPVYSMEFVNKRMAFAKKYPDRCYIYLVRLTQRLDTGEAVEFCKIGITKNTLDRRFERATHKGAIESVCEVANIFVKDRETALKFERKLHTATRSVHFVPPIRFGGSAKECRNIKALPAISRLFDQAEKQIADRGKLLVDLLPNKTP